MNQSDQRRRDRFPVRGLPGRALLLFGFVGLLLMAAAGPIHRTHAAPVIGEFPLPPQGNRGPTRIAVGPDGALWFTESDATAIGRITTAGVLTEFPAGNFSEPFDIVAGPDGAMWFTDSTEVPNAIGRITMAGVMTKFSTTTANAGIEGITVGPDGNLWFAQQDANSIGRITPLGVFLPDIAVPTVGSEPSSIVSGPDGALWFTETNGGQIGRVTIAGVVTNEFPVPGLNPQPSWITAGPDGNLWFTDNSTQNNAIGKITTGGVVTETSIPTPDSDPVVITPGPVGSNTLWFTEGGPDGAEGNKFGRITTAGVLTEFAVATAGAEPSGIVTGPDGNLWITEADKNTIARSTPAGVATEFPLPPLGAGPSRIVTGPDGNLWFTEEDVNQIGRITPAGVVTEFVAACGLDDSPFGITAGPDGALWYTCDNGDLIGRISTTGAITTFPLAGLNGGSPHEIVKGPDNNLWFTIQHNLDPTGDAIGRLTTGGAFARFALTPGTEPAGITVGPDGALWFAEQEASRIGRITTVGVVTNEFPTLTANAEPNGITTGPDGALWFTEGGTNAIGRITTGGVVTEFPNGSANGEPVGIVTGPDGALYYGEGGGGFQVGATNLVGRITTAGVVTHTATPSANSEPEGITVGPDGALWFTEGDVNKIGRLSIAAAAPTKSCTPTNPTTGASTVCTLTTTSVLPNAGTITDTVTSPVPATITACTPSAGLTCGVPAGNTVTVTCTTVGGCPAGATFQLTITSPTVGPLTESVDVTPPGGGARTNFTVAANPATAFVAPAAATAPTKSCAPTNPAVGANTVCTLTTTSALPIGGTVVDTVTGPVGATITACGAATGGLTCGGPTAGANNSVTVTCTPVACPVGATFQVTITSPAAGALTESVAVTPPGGGAATTFAVAANPPTSFVAPAAAMAPTKTCTPTNPAVGANTVCTLTTTSALANTGTIVDTVTGPVGATITACGTPTGGLTCGGPTAGANNSVTVTCTTVAGCPAGATFQVTITSTGPGTLTESAAVTPPAGGPAVNFAVAAAPLVVFLAVGGAPVTTSAIGCVNTNDQTQIQFPTQPGVAGGAVISSSNELPNAFNVNGNAQLSVLAPTSIQGLNTANLAAVTCGAVFQDSDVDPNTIDGGTITFQLGGLTANGLTIAQILESNGANFSVSCGSVGIGLTETCQGANTVLQGSQTQCPPPNGVTCVAEPTASNTVHVGLRPGITFSLIGGFSPAISIQAIYNRFAAYGAPFTLSTNSTSIGLVEPTYSLGLTPSPASIPAALGSTTGSVITASLSRATSFQCVNVAGGFSGFVVCGLVGGIATPGIAVPLISFVNGAEPGVVTFSTTSGVFGLPGNPGASAQQIASVHCGSNPGTAPIFLVPFPGQPFSFSFSSCQTVSVTLYGGGAAGTAVVTGVYVGDFTGATATAGTTVALTASSPTVALSRGCNEVITGPTTAAAASATTILGLVSPSSAVVSIWQFNNSLHAFQALYFSTAGAPTDISSVGPNQSIFICVSGAATFTVS